MKTNYKRALKFVTLLISALLIGTASATVYHNLYLSAPISVATLKLQWDDTDLDQGITANIHGAYCSITGLEAPIGGSAKYEKAIGIRATATTTFDITVVSVTGNTNDLDYIQIKIYNASNDIKADFYVWQNGREGSGCTDLSISQDEVWRLEWTIAWKESAQASSSVEVSLMITTPSP